MSDTQRNAYHLQSNEEKDNEWEQATAEPGRWRKHTRLQATLGPPNIIKSDSTTPALWIFDHGQKGNRHMLTGTHTCAHKLIQVYKYMQVHMCIHAHLTFQRCTSKSVDLP